MPGFLVSEHYELEVVTGTDTRLASIILGFFFGFGLLTCVKAATRSKKAWRRSTNAKVYVLMIWGEIIVSLVFALLGWLHIEDIIKPSFWLYFFMCTFWALQIQFLLQIIINRVSLIIYNDAKARRIKWGVAALITAVNISVYCIWIPARLQISSRMIHINEYWDRVEKVIFAICDGCLNVYFLYLVNKQLLSQGMEKYRPLFRLNICAVACSLSMDVMIVGTMSAQHSLVYVIFQSSAYMVKLNIELTMADLIAKVASTPVHVCSAYGQAFHSESISVQDTKVTASGQSGELVVEVHVEKSSKP